MANLKLTKIQKEKMRTWVEIDRGAVKHNYDTFRGMLKKPTRIMSVVKSNAYGHGLVLFAKEMTRLGVDWLGVDSYEEALELRKAGIKKPIMVLGYVSPKYFGDAVKKNISVTISSMPSLLALARMKKSPKIHIKVDTGLSRQGFLSEEKDAVLKILQKNNKIILEGAYSHFAVGEDPKARDYTERQVAEFKKWCTLFENAGYKPIRHICATSSTMMYPEFHFDMVRVGLGMYGLWPSVDTQEIVGKKYQLKPVLSWHAIISEVKNKKKGEGVGYDLTEKLSRDSRIAVIPVGYWHGYPRMLSGKGKISVNQNLCKVLGRVSMDMMVIDITEVKGVEVLNEVVLLGEKAGNRAEMVAETASTINYELLTRINPQIPRFLL